MFADAQARIKVTGTEVMIHKDSRFGEYGYSARFEVQVEKGRSEKWVCGVDEVNSDLDVNGGDGKSWVSLLLENSVEGLVLFVVWLSYICHLLRLLSKNGDVGLYFRMMRTWLGMICRQYDLNVDELKSLYANICVQGKMHFELSDKRQTLTTATQAGPWLRKCSR